jgi:hypothetical protein
MGQGMASSIDGTIYGEEDDAWRAANDECERTAEREADYQAEQRETDALNDDDE